jgi:pimeloyl-ACP methyl ester carboxylesterase
MESRWSMTIPERVSLWFAFTVVSLLTPSARCCPSAQWLIGIGGSVTTVAATSAAARLRGRSASRMRSTDCCALLSHVGVRYAHVIGHSFGGPIALQLALEVPQLVHTLTLLEAALMVGDSEKLYRQGMQQSMQRYGEAGARVVADEFLQMRWPGYREPLEKVLPGAFEQAVADAPASFAADVPAALDSSFGDAQA